MPSFMDEGEGEKQRVDIDKDACAVEKSFTPFPHFHFQRDGVMYIRGKHHHPKYP